MDRKASQCGIFTLGLRSYPELPIFSAFVWLIPDFPLLLGSNLTFFFMANARGADPRLIVGLIFLLLGLYFLLNNFDLIPFELPDYITSWQVFLILIGLLLLASRERQGGGVILIVVGVVFLLPEFFDVSVGEVVRQFWPLALVAIGVVLLVRRSQEKKTTNEFEVEGEAVTPDRVWIDSVEFIDETAILGGNDRLITSEYFRGGKITTIFGSNEVNFVNARLAEGQHELDVFTLFGSTELTVPRDWNVTVDVTPILGSFEDRRRQVLLPGNPSRQLTIRGLVLFGSGELMSV